MLEFLLNLTALYGLQNVSYSWAGPVGALSGYKTIEGRYYYVKVSLSYDSRRATHGFLVYTLEAELIASIGGIELGPDWWLWSLCYGPGLKQRVFHDSNSQVDTYLFDNFKSIINAVKEVTNE